MSRGILALLMFLIALNGLAEEQGLLLYLPFDEGSGKVAKDISGNGNDGQIIDAEWVNGKFGKALSFNGKTAYVEVAIYKRAISADEAESLYKGAANLKAVIPKSKLAAAWGELKIKN